LPPDELGLNWADSRFVRYAIMTCQGGTYDLAGCDNSDLEVPLPPISGEAHLPKLANLRRTNLAYDA
jgi:hypothetical protein